MHLNISYEETSREKNQTNSSTTQHQKSKTNQNGKACHSVVRLLLDCKVRFVKTLRELHVFNWNRWTTIIWTYLFPNSCVRTQLHFSLDLPLFFSVIYYWLFQTQVIPSNPKAIIEFIPSRQFIAGWRGALCEWSALPKNTTQGPQQRLQPGHQLESLNVLPLFTVKQTCIQRTLLITCRHGHQYFNMAEVQGKETHKFRQTKFFTTQGLFLLTPVLGPRWTQRAIQNKTKRCYPSSKESLRCGLTTGNWVRKNNAWLCIQRNLAIIMCDIRHCHFVAQNIQ